MVKFCPKWRINIAQKLAHNLLSLISAIHIPCVHLANSPEKVEVHSDLFDENIDIHKRFNLVLARLDFGTPEALAAKSEPCIEALEGEQEP